MNNTNDSNRLFISYSRADADVVHAIRDALVARGINVWIDQNNIEGGGDILARINDGLAQSKVFVAFVGDTYFADGRFTQAEFGAAFFKALSVPDWRVLVVKLSENIDLPPMVASRLYFVHKSPNSTADKIVGAIGSDAGVSSEIENQNTGEAQPNFEPLELTKLTNRDLDIIVDALLLQRFDRLRETGKTATMEIDLPRGRQVKIQILRALLENEAVFLTIGDIKQRIHLCQRYISHYIREINEGLLGKFAVPTQVALEGQQLKLDQARTEMLGELTAIIDTAKILHDI